MSNTINIRVDKSLQEVLENIRKKVAMDLKSKYNLNTITISGNLASQILAAKMKGKSNVNFKIRKTTFNSGVLELI